VESTCARGFTGAMCSAIAADSGVWCGWPTSVEVALLRALRAPRKWLRSK